MSRASGLTIGLLAFLVGVANWSDETTVGT